MSENFRMINATEELVAFCDLAQANGWLALDTEFVRTRTLYADLGLVQARTGAEIVLVDPLNGVDLAPLWQLLRSDIIAVLHAAGEDLEIFQRNNAAPQNLFDTQVANAFITDGSQIGYAGLVEQMLHVSLDKSQSRTDWLQRPLSPAQLEYAAADVEYLAELYPSLRAKTVAAGMEELVLAECQEQVAKRARESVAELAWRDIGGVNLLTGQGRAVLRELAAWRLTLAREKNIALPFVARDHVLTDIARKLPNNRQALSVIDELHPKSLRLYGEAMLACVEKGLAAPEEQHPEEIPRYDQDPEYKRFFKAAKALLKAAGEKANVPVPLMGSRKQINEVYVWQHFTRDETKEKLYQPDLYQGWRGALVAEQIAELVAKSYS
ncbi:ribonuclease D [Aliidiomarina iranensis]|uniref:Ribonuclease D n=1 Tax=Aliidiomarina iranensis TaxID=1434071 RepID=A0A432VSI9_9GAMM|nr:ribonuclease D [Aliidiomarina iranensis]RUO19318.1 ribonuclease D [Aliidiomarina iranensis]